MRGSWRIARILGIDLSVHWSFGLLLAWILFSSVTGFGLAQGVFNLAFVLALFACVVLHELGHAMAARYYGIPTHGITLLPIGGVAQLERIPREPWQEFVIAIAGPAVNVFLAGLMLPMVALFHGAAVWSSPLAIGEGLLTRLMWVNVMLVCFNLIPAFPMDGGRVLRSFLASRINYLRATLWAKRTGQFVAALFAILGLWTNPMLLLIAFFIVSAAENEYQMVRREFRDGDGEPGELPSGAWSGTVVESPHPPNLPTGRVLPPSVVVIHAYPLNDLDAHT